MSVIGADVGERSESEEERGERRQAVKSGRG